VKPIGRSEPCQQQIDGLNDLCPDGEQFTQEGPEVPLMNTRHFGDHGDQGFVLEPHRRRQAGHGFGVQGSLAIQGHDHSGCKDRKEIRLHIQQVRHIASGPGIRVLVDVVFPQI